MRIFSKIIFPHDRLHSQEINYAFKGSFKTNRNLHWNWVCTKTINDRFDGALKGCPHTIHFINKTNTRNPVAVCLTPNRFTLWLNTLHRIEYNYSAIKYT